jgi:hypothetical protein
MRRGVAQWSVYSGDARLMCWVQVREGITMHGYVSTLKVVSRVVCDERLEAMILHGTKLQVR